MGDDDDDEGVDDGGGNMRDQLAIRLYSFLVQY